MQFIGYFLAFCAMVFAIYYSFTRKITFKKGAVTSLIILFISLIFIFDEITVEGIGLLRKARSDAKAIKEIRTELESDAKDLSNLKAKLDSMFTINSKNQLEFRTEIVLGPTFFGDSPGVAKANYFTVGTDTNTHGLILVQGNGVNLITAEVDGDGSGGVDTPRVTINNLLKLTPRSDAPTYAEEGFIYYDSTEHKLKVFNGKKWENIIK